MSAFRSLVPPALSDIVDAIGDWDIPDRDDAKNITLKHPPGTAITLVAQYRTPFQVEWQFGEDRRECRESPISVSRIDNGVIRARPNGPAGVIIVSLKPEAAERILGANLSEFSDRKIGLENLCNAREVGLLEEILAESKDSAERFAHVEAFLLRRARRSPPASVAHRAATLLRSFPDRSISGLASTLGISERHLSRSFQLTFGMSPKRFARIARVEKVVTARRRGAAWADIAYACGYADQAHLIRDFSRVVGESPQNFMRPASGHETLALAGCPTITYAVSRLLQQDELRLSRAIRQPEALVSRFASSLHSQRPPDELAKRSGH